MSRPSTISAWASRFSRRKTSPWVVDEGLLRSLVPLNLLGPAELRALVDQARVVKLDGGRELQRDPAAGPATGYLLSGIVEVMDGGGSPTAVAAGTDAARRPLWDGKRGAVTLRAKTDVMVLELNAAADELALAGSADSGDYEVSDIRSATATDWLTRFLQAKVFIRLPLNNIRELLARMEEIEFDAGQAVMRQGESDGYYYIVKRGACRVTTRGEGGREIELARLGEGDGFGEDALITDGRRSATVTMVAEGSLMRLGKQDFTSLLVEPVLQYVDTARALEMMQSGGAVILDVRKPEEYARDGLKTALNIPLNMLRSRCADLDPQKAYVAVSNVLNRSTAAAFFLCQHGLEAYILKDGVKALAESAPPAAAPAQPAMPSRPAPVLSLVSGGAAEPAPPAAAAAPQAAASVPAPAAAAGADDHRSGELRAANERLTAELQQAQAQLAQERERGRGLAQRLEAGEALARRSDELTRENKDLAARNDELGRRSEELARRHEELDRRADEMARRSEELAQALAARETALAEAAGGRERHDAERAELAARLDEAQLEIQRLEQERARDREAAAGLETVRDELQRATGRNGDLERRLELQSQELERLRQALAAGESAEAEVMELQRMLQAERDGAAAELQALRDRAAEAAQALASQTAELQRLRDAEAVAASIRAECDALEQRLHVEGGRREESAARIAELEQRLAQAEARRDETETLQAETGRLNEALARERRDRRTFERELALQTVELQRLRRSRDEADGEQAARIAAVQAELDEQHRRLAEAQAREAAQAKQMQEFMRQGQRLRSRLKKVCTLARDMEHRRRAAEQAVAQQALETKALKEQVYERSLRLAELELVRRKLEQDIAAARPARPPAEAAAQPAPAAVLRLPSPEDRAAPAERAPRLSLAGRRALQLTVLIAATLICVYGLLATGILKAHAGDWSGRIMEIAGLLDGR